VTATEAVVLLAFEPVAASITSIVWDHEAITLPFLGGAALILTAMVLSQLPERPSRPQPQ
jgi:drug/metabolite transporter (DMT)-like permease